MPTTRHITFYAILIWLLALSFYCYEFFLSIFLGSIAKNVMVDLKINSEQFALITAAYFYTYSLMQTPVGLLADKFGARRVLTVAATFCAVGALWFALSHHYITSVFARFLIGFASSFGFVSALVVILNWFSHKHFSLFSGLTQFLASVFGVVAGGPLVLIVNSFGGNWRIVLIGIACIGGLLAILIGIFVRDKPRRSKEEVVMISPPVPLKEQVGMVLKTPRAWNTALYTAFVYVTLPLLGAYWGTLYLEARGLRQELAATVISMVWLGMAVGCPLCNRLSDWLRRRKLVMLIASASGVVFTCFVLYFPVLPLWVMFVLFFAIGLSGSGQSVAYPTMTEYVPDVARAAALGINNTGITFFGGLIPMIVGSFITYLNKMHHLAPNAVDLEVYTIALSSLPMFFLIAFLIALFGIKETYGRPQQKVHHLSKSD